MVFTSPSFLFGFLPLILLGYYLAPKITRNFILLAGSLFFYAWGEGVYVLLMVTAIGWNYFVGRWIDDTQGRRRKLVLAVGVTINLASLLVFKYAGFVDANLGLGWALTENIHLPLGISFFTFQSLSYLVDVYRRTTPAQGNILNLGLYIALFPQLIAGPIIRYRSIADQLLQRTHSVPLFASGVERFSYGMAKKLLIANPLGLVADKIFTLDSTYLTPELAWLGVICYALQIYFDFSGYSDMAIGLGRMFGFRFQENFNYPYIATSIRDFWRRWHISLSQWFRDYLYIPLGGSRKGAWRTYFNLILVFLLCGLWHGSSWNFVVWGMLHGCFLVLERLGLGKLLNALPRFVAHAYTLLVVLIAWVFFRVENWQDAWLFLGRMFSFSAAQWEPYSSADFVDHQFYLTFVVAILLCMPIASSITSRFGKELHSFSGTQALVRAGAVSLMLLLSVIVVSASTYNPFIYFRF